MGDAPEGWTELLYQTGDVPLVVAKDVQLVALFPGNGTAVQVTDRPDEWVFSGWPMVQRAVWAARLRAIADMLAPDPDPQVSALVERNLRVLRHEMETPMRGHDEDGMCCRRAAMGAGS